MGTFVKDTNSKVEVDSSVAFVPYVDYFHHEY